MNDPSRLLRPYRRQAWMRLVEANGFVEDTDRLSLLVQHPGQGQP